MLLSLVAVVVAVAAVVVAVADVIGICANRINNSINNTYSRWIVAVVQELSLMFWLLLLLSIAFLVGVAVVCR